MVIMPDADVEQAVSGLMGAAYGSAGERCMAISAAISVGPIGDIIVEQLKEKVESLKIGPGFNKDLSPDMGPLITREHKEKVESYIEVGISEGATLVTDGRKFIPKGHEEGFFLGGCLFDNVTKDMSIYKDEIFGPVLSVVRVQDFNAGCELINNHESG